MATSKLVDDKDGDLCCSICLDLFKEPVMLECGHHFCKSCIDEVWNSAKTPACPECREECPAKKYTVNRLLSKLVEKARRVQQSEKAETRHQEQKDHSIHETQQCLEHNEVLKLFCQEDKSPMCVVCMVSTKHTGHSFLPLQEAVSLFQGKLKEASSLLELKVKYTIKVHNQQEQYISDLQHITSQFAKLHQFLQDREKNLIQQLKEETAGIIKKMKENLRDIKNRSNAIQKGISNMQSAIQQEDPVNFLRGLRNVNKIYMNPPKEENLPKAVLGSCDKTREMYNDFISHNWNEWKSNMRPEPLTRSMQCTTYWQ
ncbi:zinc-binding protein A33-like isoform X2 [Protopterus annectens]|uniref:zinc-binding protein A33-like isoform X2 n=1 Tax=Protopterus annectens TaxID=7888 RepID=UPI001CFB27A6|nr:zinc-binding protein A33-like isoform X2 [Protopterus annectens]